MVITYRDNEVGEDHPLSKMRSQIQAAIEYQERTEKKPGISLVEVIFFFFFFSEQHCNSRTLTVTCRTDFPARAKP